MRRPPRTKSAVVPASNEHRADAICKHSQTLRATARGLTAAGNRRYREWWPRPNVGPFPGLTIGRGPEISAPTPLLTGGDAHGSGTRS